MEESSAPSPAETPKKLSPWVIAAIVLVVLCCCCIVAVLVVPMILGPSIGSVFSNIILELGTPMP
jgi:hypothetical protein